MSPPSSTVLILVICLLISFTGNYNASSITTLSSFTVDLVHSHARDDELISTRGGPKQPKTTLAERLDEMIQSNHARQRLISSHPRLRMKAASSEVEIPARVAAALNMPGQFMAVFRVGSPPQEFMLVVDTGSHLTWVNCSLGSRSFHHDHDQEKERVFHANLSTSFETVPCSSQICSDISFDGGCNHSSTSTPCAFEIGYGDESTSAGVLANETVTAKLKNGHDIELQDVLIGCSTSTAGDYGVADGVLGLGYSKHSFALQMLEKFGNKFSYCWGDITIPSNNTNNYLTFGNNNNSSLPSMQYTELVLKYEPYYMVNVTGISVGGVMLNISSPGRDIASFEGAVIVDSGSTFTLLTDSAYEPVLAALKPPLLAKYGEIGNSTKMGLFDFCFNASTGHEFDESLVPNLAFHFADGVEFVPPVRNYVVEVEYGVRCVGLFPSWIGVSVIGNVMQQNMHWEYNLGAKKLGFAPSTTSCA